MARIQAGSLVYMSGDEMSEVIMQLIVDGLIHPFLDLNIERFDLSVENRGATGDQVTKDATAALRRTRVGVKAATITPTPAQTKELGLPVQLTSPNGGLRNAIDGTIFRMPVVSKAVTPRARFVTKPVLIARHAFGDQYKSQQIAVNQPGTVTLVFTPADGGTPTTKVVNEFSAPGVAMGIFNLDASITAFARNVFSMALEVGMPVTLTTKDTILPIYDGAWKRIFQEIFDTEFRAAFEKARLTYEHTLIDTVAERIMKGPGGFLWACTNRDGDVQSDSIGGMFGSNGMMGSFLRSPDGSIICAEAAHGTVTRHYKLWKEGKETSTNPVASIAAWCVALDARGKFDDNDALVQFAARLNTAMVETLDAGTVTGDILDCVRKEVGGQKVSAQRFIELMRERLARHYSGV